MEGSSGSFLPSEPRRGRSNRTDAHDLPRQGGRLTLGGLGSPWRRPQGTPRRWACIVARILLRGPRRWWPQGAGRDRVDRTLTPGQTNTLCAKLVRPLKSSGPHGQSRLRSAPRHFKRGEGETNSSQRSLQVTEQRDNWGIHAQTGVSKIDRRFGGSNDRTSQSRTGASHALEDKPF